MTLPYSTTGYDEFGPENGYTNTSVQATGPYTFSTNGTAATIQTDVSEAQVVGADDSVVTVDISEATGTGQTIESGQ